MHTESPDPIHPSTLDHLHPEAITDSSRIDSLLNGWMKSSTLLRRGSNSSADLELSTIHRLGSDHAVLHCRNFGPIDDVLFLSTEYEGIPYFFSIQVLQQEELHRKNHRIIASKPAVVYRAERRDRVRLAATSPFERIRLSTEGRETIEGQVVDYSGDGLGVLIPSGSNLSSRQEVQIEGPHQQPRRWAIVRNNFAEKNRPGWTRIGLSVLPVRPRGEVRIESAANILSQLGGLCAQSPDIVFSEQPNIVAFYNNRGEKLVGILDHCGEMKGAPAVLVPSAWGKTKETLAAFAATILATFSGANRPVSVLRFDGIRKRGESHNDPECSYQGLENLNYTFSQGADDLVAAARYLRHEYGCSSVTIASFSIASVEARRAIATDRDGLFDGWVSIVGATDPQSLIRIISGGVDYLAGAEKGIKFGRQDVQGMLLDIDRTAGDALANKIAFLDDARRDFARISCPISWIVGAHDAWMNLARVRDCLSFGPSGNRKVILSETGHQLRDSKVAAETFGLAATECARFSGVGSHVRPTAPNPRQVRQRILAERKRRRKHEVRPDLRLFWRDYLVGRKKTLGMELIAETSSYRSLLRDQIAAMGLSGKQTIVDLGSGLSTFERALAEEGIPLAETRIVSIDLVPEALRRGRERLPEPSRSCTIHVAADLSASDSAPFFPLLSQSADYAVASLVLNYLDNPRGFLRGTLRLLKPGGRLVLTALRDDADTSKLCVDGIGELRTGRGLASFGESRERLIDQALGPFINDAALLLDFEERGFFKFWKQDELVEAARRAGFEEISISMTFGSPPQAWLLSAVRPR